MFDQVWQNILALGLAFMVLALIGALIVYFLPSIIAAVRRKRQFDAILMLNLFAGWTVAGWVGALVWSVLREESDGTRRE